MTVKELRDKLELLNGEDEVLVIDDNYDVHGIERIGLDQYFSNELENPNYIPFCIKIN